MIKNLANQEKVFFKQEGECVESLQTEELQPIELHKLPDDPFVSVLIANYNYANYISEAIESVLCQTYPHFEVIVCDDGSTDNSCEIIKQYIQRDSRVKLVQQQNGGVASALNRAFSESKGLIFCLLDADDYYSPEKLDRVVQAFIAHPESGMLMHPLMRVDTAGSHRGRLPLLNPIPQGWLGPQLLQLGSMRAMPPASGICFRLEVARKLFPIPEKFKSAVDSIIQRIGGLLTPINALDDVLSFYRLHESNITGIYTSSFTPAYLEKYMKGFDVYCETCNYITSWLNMNFPNVQVAPLESHFGYVESRYWISKLTKEQRSIQSFYYKKLLAHPQTAENLLFYYFYKFSLWLPLPLFQLGSDMIYQPNRFKAILSKWVKWKKRR